MWYSYARIECIGWETAAEKCYTQSKEKETTDTAKAGIGIQGLITWWCVYKYYVHVYWKCITYSLSVFLFSQQKEETGEVCHEVDFQQLKIENKQLTERCDEKNQELLKLKLRAADTLQILNTYKVELLY